MLFLIGGPARCGKSVLTERLAAQTTMRAISLDAFRKDSLTSWEVCQRYPALSLQPSHEQFTPDEWVRQLRERDKALWLLVETRLLPTLLPDEDVILEGAIWPDYVTDSTRPLRAVYLVDTSLDHVRHLTDSIKRDKLGSNWLHGRSASWLATWALYNRRRSELYTQLCAEYAQPVFDVAAGGYEAAQTAAMTYLLRATQDDTIR